MIRVKAQKGNLERPPLRRRGSSDGLSRCVMFQSSQGERAVVTILVLPVSEIGPFKVVK